MEPNNYNYQNNGTELRNGLDYTPSQNFSRPPQKSKFKELLPTLIIIISAPILAWMMSIFIFRTYVVDGPSMLTTLHDKDRLIINKLPKTFGSLTNHNYIPKRYDIIVFKHSGVFSYDSRSKNVIKRVIGLPGERVLINNGEVKIFNKDNPAGYLVDKAGPEANVIPTTEGNLDITVPKGEVFVLGDNRVNSLDSRELGTIKSSDIVGVLSLRIFPFKDFKSF